MSQGSLSGRVWLGKALLGGAGAAVSALIYALWIERVRVQLDRRTIRIDKPGLPPEGITVLHLSDFHFRSGGRIQARKVANLRRLLAHEQYDFVALTGDLIHDAAGFPAALALIQDLHPRLGGYSCPGNHDYMEYSVWGMFDVTERASGSGRGSSWTLIVGVAGKLLDFGRKVLKNELVRLPLAPNDVTAMQAAMEARGITTLVNRAVHVQGVGLDLWIAGVDDETEGQPNLPVALAEVPEGALLLLLAHNPDVWLEPEAQRVDLILAGHTHGGQIRLPLVGAAHTQGTHLTRQRPAGWFQRGTARMYVSRGLGESIPLRLGVPPQVALIRLVPLETAEPGAGS
jgi:uncharacterized protein